MPEREKSCLRAALAGEQMRLTDHRPVQAGNQGLSQHLSNAVLGQHLTGKNPINCTHIVALPRRGIFYLFPDSCHYKPLQHVPQRWQQVSQTEP